MKKIFPAKLTALSLALILSLAALSGCGSAPAQPSQPSQASGSSASAGEAASSVGTVLLSVNPEIEMDYDAAGNVVALTGLNEDGRAVLASYTGYQGRACADVIGELVDAIHAGGYFDGTIGGHEKNIVLKLERGSEYPRDGFLDELAQAVRTVVEADAIGSQTVALGQDAYDDAYGDRGYINAQAARELLSTQLGRDDIQFVEKEYDLDDGEYELEFVLDGVEYEYEVNAVTGKVVEMDADYQDYDSTDYGPDGDGITDYGYTNYDDNGTTNYGSTNYDDNGATNYTNYGSTNYDDNGTTNYTNYGSTNYDDNGATNYTNYGNTNYDDNGTTNYGSTNYDDGGSNYGSSDYDD